MITLEDARRIVSAAEEKAREMGQPMDIAVLDGGRNLKSFARMDGAWLGSIEIAIDKAYTSTSFEMTTEELATMAQPGQPLFGINTTSNSRVVIFAGGIPIERNGEVVGAEAGAAAF
jgi:uncharacterized protein GlcG (DUF336 family)